MSVSLSGLVAFVAPLALYIVTLSPGVDFWDIGEMQTVPYVLGIAHPTGFPAFVLLGWAFSHVLPLGTPAWRISLMCAIASAFAACALFACVRALCGDARIACATALAFAVGDVVWVHAVRADVHDLALATIAIALAAATRAGLARSQRALAIAALALGCALATHPIAALASASVVILAWPAFVAASAAMRVRSIALLLVPLLLYAYVPLRSAYVETHGLDPARELGLVGGAIFDSGAPATLATFWRYVTGAEFHTTRAFASAVSPPGFAHAVAFAREYAYREDGVLFLAFAVVGWLYLAVTHGRVACALALVPLAFAAFAANYPAESDVARYALVALWVVAACAGVGAWWLASVLAPKRVEIALAVATALVFASMLPRLGAATYDIGHARVVDDATVLGTTVARYTRDGSLVIATWNYATPLFYDTYVARSLGTRKIASGWPHDFPGRYDAWRARYKHVYFVLAASYDVTPFATPVAANGTWQLAELRS